MTAPATPGTPYLIHSFEHRAYTLGPDHPLSIGREPTCDITVNEVAVSRHHAEIKAEGDDYVLYPTGSTSTMMNGMPVAAPFTLHEGDTFMVGTMKFMFTRGKLPVAMQVARHAERPSTVEGRRPTLTFPGQPYIPEPVQVKRGLSIPLIFVVLIVAVAAAALVLLGRH